jgi:uncharacterized protein YjeT (DUF2065 family)
MSKSWLLLMNFQWNIFIAALGLALILEGLPYFLGPEAVKKFVGKVLELPPSKLRFFGLTGIIAGLTLVALSRFLG